jgi:hypothetical protein
MSPQYAQPLMIEGAQGDEVTESGVEFDCAVERGHRAIAGTGEACDVEARFLERRWGEG